MFLRNTLRTSKLKENYKSNNELKLEKMISKQLLWKLIKTGTCLCEIDRHTLANGITAGFAWNISFDSDV